MTIYSSVPNEIHFVALSKIIKWNIEKLEEKINYFCNYAFFTLNLFVLIRIALSPILQVFFFHLNLVALQENIDDKNETVHNKSRPDGI